MPVIIFIYLKNIVKLLFDPHFDSSLVIYPKKNGDKERLGILHINILSLTEFEEYK